MFIKILLSTVKFMTFGKDVHLCNYYQIKAWVLPFIIPKSSLVPFCIDWLLPLCPVNHCYIFCPFIVVFSRMLHQWSHTTCSFFVSVFFFHLIWCFFHLVRVIHFVACKLLIIFPGFVFPFYAFTKDIHLDFS